MFHPLYEHLTLVAIVLISIFVWAFLKWGQGRNLNIPSGPNGWPLIGNLPAFLSSNPSEFFAECSKKFGDIFKLQLGQQKVFIVSNIDLVREVFSNRNAQNRIPNASYYKVFGQNAHGVVFASNSPWKDTRQFILRVFRDLGVGRGPFESKIVSEAERLAAKIGEGVDRRELHLKEKFFGAAVIHETERISTVLPLGLPHLTEKDIQLSGFDLPKGSAIAANMKVIFMNDSVFENPYEFNPDRFIKDGVFEESSHVIPFSTGSRVCPGEMLARMQLFIFLSHLLHRYSFKPPKDVTLPRTTDGIEDAVARSPLPYPVVISERFPSNDCS